MFPFFTGKFDFLHQFVLLPLRRSLRPRRSWWRTSSRASESSCTRSSCRELKPGGTGWVLDLLFPLSRTSSSLTSPVSVSPPPAGAVVVGQRLSRVPQCLSADRELCRAGTLFGALLASCRGNGPGEGQYLLLAHAAVLESDPHVMPVRKLSIFHDYLRFRSLPCFRETLAPQKAGQTPLDMDQFRMLYCTCKVPGVTKDTISNYFKTGATTSPLHTRMRR